MSLESPAVKTFLEKIIRNIREGGRKNRIGILQARTGKIANQLGDRTTDQEYILFDTSAAMLERADRERNTLNQYEYSVIRQGHIEINMSVLVILLLPLMYYINLQIRKKDSGYPI